jgi:hypothetical protein
MNIEQSINCVEENFKQNPDKTRPDKHLLELLRISLYNNDFEFNGKFYLQIMGTAMGKRFAPGLANLYLLRFDEAAKNNFRIKPVIFFRYLDDIFFLWPGDRESLKEYEIFLNNIIPDIKVTLECSEEQINFLDTTIYKASNTLQTRVYFKPTDTHQLLHKTSFHPTHTCNGILKSQLIRFKRISSSKLDFDNTCKILFSALKKRGYTYSQMRQLKRDIWLNYTVNRERNNEQNEELKQPIIPIIVDYCKLGLTLGREYKNIIKNANKFNNCKTLLAYKIDKNLKQLLVKSKLESNTVGSFIACRQINCKTCKTHTHNDTLFHSTKTRKTYNIKGVSSCNTKNIVYLITCKKCQLQYVGETSRTLRERLNEHRSAIKTKNINSPIGIHFNLANHSITDLGIIIIEKITHDNSSLRKNCEKHWQRKLKTIYPHGLNALAL